MTRWLRVYQSVPRPRHRLVCLPHAGGAASFFHSWKKRMPPDVDLLAVAYPGRQERLGEACVEEMDVLAGAVAEALVPLLDRPLALFGHSMGAAVAYEVALRLDSQRLDSQRLTRLFVSGRPAPQVARPLDVAGRGDDELIRHTRTLGGIDQGVLDDPDLRELVLPALRADYRLVEAYRPAGIRTTAVPIMSYVGTGDPACSVADVSAWSEVTTGGYDLRTFPGDHFYLVPAADEVISDVLARL